MDLEVYKSHARSRNLASNEITGQLSPPGHCRGVLLLKQKVKAPEKEVAKTVACSRRVHGPTPLPGAKKKHAQAGEALLEAEVRIEK